MLGRFGALFGLLSFFVLIRRIGFSLFPLSLVSLVLGLAGSWELGKHRMAESLAFFVGGFFPLVSGFLLF